MVGTTRFELTTSSTPSKRCTKLSYVPMCNQHKHYYNKNILFVKCRHK